MERIRTKASSHSNSVGQAKASVSEEEDKNSKEDYEGGSKVDENHNNNNQPRDYIQEVEFDEPQEKNSKKQKEPELKELSTIEKFFHNYWNHWMSKMKYIVFIVTLIWIGIAIWRVTLFKPAKDPIKRLSDDHELEILDNMITDEFHAALNTGKIEVSFIWGIKRLDRSGIGRWEPENRGKLVYDEEFNLAPEANQLRLSNI